MPCEFFRLIESSGIVAEGFLEEEGVAVVDLEGEVTGFAIEG